ncbi:unnamed protein product [Gordionus sp. m RMFG-2023]
MNTSGLLMLAILLLQLKSYLVKAGGTIEPIPNFNAEADAKALRTALKGAGTDDKKLINIIPSRTNFERQQITRAYKSLFKRDLINDIKGDTSGDFENILVALMMPAAEYDAQQIRKSIKGFGTNFDLLIEILLTRSPNQLKAITEAYKKLFKKDIVSDIKGDTNRKVQDFLVKIAQAQRDSSRQTDPAAALRDAEKLLKGGIQQLFGTNEKAFTDILATRNINQLKLIFDQYERISKQSIEDAIKKETSGKYQKTLLTFVDIIKNPGNYFATRLHSALTGVGTKESDLTRIMVTRSEVDMEEIKNEYRKKYKKSLENAIKGDVTGTYQEVLVKLVQGNQKPIQK